MRNMCYNIIKGLKNLFTSGSRTVSAAQLPAIMAARTHCVCFGGLQVAVSVRNGGSTCDGFFTPASPLLSPEKRSGRANKQASKHKKGRENE